MSERTWKPGAHPDWFVTGTPTVGASVHWDVARFRWVAEAWTRDGREMRERGLVTHPAAMVVAERWLDGREAEGRGTPASSGEPAAKPEPKTGRWVCRECGAAIVIRGAKVTTVLPPANGLWQWTSTDPNAMWMHRCEGQAEFWAADRIGEVPPKPAEEGT